jgi:hypothetical protein
MPIRERGPVLENRCKFARGHVDRRARQFLAPHPRFAQAHAARLLAAALAAGRAADAAQKFDSDQCRPGLKLLS